VSTRLVTLVAGRRPRLGDHPSSNPTRSRSSHQRPGDLGIPLVFVPVTDPKTTPNRVHLDLADPEGNELCVLSPRRAGLQGKPVGFH
jgi:hypothetical protein